MRLTSFILSALTATLTTGAPQPRIQAAPGAQHTAIGIGPRATDLHAPTYILDTPTPGGNHSKIELQCTKMGPQCMDFPPGAPANQTFSVRVYCANNNLSGLRPVIMNPCPQGSKCTWTYTSPEAAAAGEEENFEEALWTQDEDGFVPGLALEEELSSWINLEGLIRRVDDGEEKGQEKESSGSVMPVSVSSYDTYDPERLQGKPYKFYCVVDDDDAGGNEAR
ncbi:hypothetical protein F5Y12DRAFT_798447 [Xylaria sp. FL1777]|nr:hypothetical protein F5Y12DRAFT_798447 [Xylaria sp. FL1777]